uniref:Uncharacterized protein n=1 Tax=Tetradesmus obliquus TaxID=3088 RepID=A0A383WMU8_TETOB|eukprot:jgi/Sobl393_1/622/SZX78504.1
MTRFIRYAYSMTTASKALLQQLALVLLYITGLASAGFSGIRSACTDAASTSDAKLSAQNNATSTACGAPTASLRTGGESSTSAVAHTRNTHLTVIGSINSGKTSLMESLTMNFELNQAAYSNKTAYNNHKGRYISFDDITVDECPGTNANSTTTPIDATTTTTATNKNTTTTTNTMPTTTPTVNTTATNIKNTIINTKNTITNTNTNTKNTITNTNTNSKPIIAMRPSDDLQPGHEEDQQGSSTTPANGATTQKNAQATLPKALVEMANEYLTDYSKRTAARKAHNHTSSATDSRSSNSSGKSVNSTQALLEELDIFLEHGKEMIAARLPKSV